MCLTLVLCSVSWLKNQFKRLGLKRKVSDPDIEVVIEIVKVGLCMHAHNRVNECGRQNLLGSLVAVWGWGMHSSLMLL